MNSSNRVFAYTLAALVAIGAGSVRAEDAPEVSVSVDATALSAYVWRGQVLNDEAVLQPSLTASKGGFSINWWGNANLTDEITGDSMEFSEHDIGISYSTTCPLTGAEMTLGVVNYDFPNQSIPGDAGNVSLVNDTREVYAIAAFSEVLLAPTLTVYYDFKEADGFYGNLAVSHEVKFCEYASGALSASVGVADKDYNSFYFGTDDSALNDANVGLSIPIQAGESLVITPGVQYTWLLDSDIEDAADALYKDKDQVIASLKASYAF